MVFVQFYNHITGSVYWCIRTRYDPIKGITEVELDMSKRLINANMTMEVDVLIRGTEILLGRFSRTGLTG